MGDEPDEANDVLHTLNFSTSSRDNNGASRGASDSEPGMPIPVLGTRRAAHCDLFPSSRPPDVIYFIKQ